MNQSDWDAVRDALIADDRATLGEPPSVDELLAYERGELPKEDAERVQQLLVAYPELARAYATPFPSDDAQPGDSDYLASEVIDRQWNAFHADHRGDAGNRADHGSTGRVLQFWPSVAAIAAAIAIVFGAMLWRTHTELLRPHVLPEAAAILTPDGRRGGAEPPQVPITPKGDSLLLVVSLVGPTDYDTYRLELVSNDSHKRLWSSEPLRATANNSFSVEFPSRALPSGTYQVIAYGLRGNAQEEVATYTIGIRRPTAP
ncbi:MAG TPA: hypothetical protein VNN25_20875 [Thermoanaerobaculia bacterium]|nr:hypothetical protein [Thermoanaerobaculia bacterium]